MNRIFLIWIILCGAAVAQRGRYVPPDRPVIVTVAGKFATAKQRRMADYRCDGVLDEVEINLAINALPISGTHMSSQPIGRVQLVGGQFHITSPILISGGVTLAGENPVGTVVFCGLAGGAAVSDDYNAVEFKSGITAYQFAQVVDLGFWGYANGFDGGTRTESQGINLNQSGAANCKIINCRIKGFNGTAVYLLSANYGCSVVNTFIQGFGGDVEDSRGIRGGNLIQGCVITDCDNAIYIPDNGALIIGNHLEDSGKAAILSNSSDGVYIGNLIEGSNVDTGQGNATIYLTAGSYNTFIGNQIHCSEANEDYGIRSVSPSDFVIAINNVITGADTVDISLAGDNNIYDNASKIQILEKDLSLAVKTVIKTINLDSSDDNDDFEFDDTAGNSTSQNVDMGAIIPAYAEVVSVQARCFETVGGSQTFQVTLGTASAGNQLLAQTTIDAANEIDGTATGLAPKLEAANAAKNVWINGDPSANWSDCAGAGRWAVIITYIDYGAVYTVDNP